MNIITLTKENLLTEHICCAISNNNDIQVSSKKHWIAERLADGLMFKKCDVRGKCFIEYIPAEKAWAPVNAENYMYINCLWVAGQFKGQGYSNLLLNECIKDAKQKNKDGLVILSSTKKLPYLADPAYLKHKGFMLADKALPNFELMYLPFNEKAIKPSFKPQVKNAEINENGFVIYYSNQCPFTAKYVPIVADMAKKLNVEFKAVKFENTKQAQESVAPVTSYALFYNGKFITNEILSDKKFEKICLELTKS